jgi:uncharacterized membrane protein YkvA (DUF1232 family)
MDTRQDASPNFFHKVFRYGSMNILLNKFFKLALSRAAHLAGKPGRILALLTQLALKIRQTKGEGFKLKTLREHFQVIGRMLKAHARGSYKIKSTRLMLILLAAVIYFINPFDLIPDLIFGIGLADDFAVLTWAYSAAAGEVALFQQWEDANLKTVKV